MGGVAKGFVRVADGTKLSNGRTFTVNGYVNAYVVLNSKGGNTNPDYINVNGRNIHCTTSKSWNENGVYSENRMWLLTDLKDGNTFTITNADNNDMTTLFILGFN